MNSRQNLIHSMFCNIWPTTRGDARLVVAILDGPVDLKHSCLAAADLQMLGVAGQSATMDARSSRHGTHVASQIFAAGDCGIAGIAPLCRGLIIPVYRGDNDGGLLPASQVDLARGIHLAVEHGADIINISGGQLSASDEADHFLANALTLCEQSGVLVVAAAGNNGCDCLHVPAAVDTVIAVGAFDPASGKPAAFSNWGAPYQSNGILAPGVHIPGAQSPDGIAAQSGTSFAAPIVAGAAALLMSLQLRRHGLTDANAVRSALLRGAERCDAAKGDDCRGFLAGKLDLARTLQLLFPDPDGLVAAPRAIHALTAANPDAMRATALPAAAIRPSECTWLHSGVLPPPRPLLNEKLKQEGPMTMSNDTDPNTAAILPSGDFVADAASVAPSVYAPTTADPAGVTPSHGCGCGGGAGAGAGDGGCGCTSCAGQAGGQLVFALGELGYDLGTEARKDSLWQAMGGDPFEWDNLIKHLDKNPWDAEAVTWTLRIDATPIYAIRPEGAFAAEAYRRLADSLIGQIGGRAKGKETRKIDRISLPGRINGAVTLSTGVVVPVVEPALRGMYSWDTSSLVQSLSANADASAALTNFLQRIYYDLRNLGLAPQDRARNFAATNAFQANEIFARAVERGVVLDQIDVQKSPICRQDSDCWDVVLTFFDPQNDRAARDVHRFTVDVSDVIPVTVGSVRNWFVR